VIGPLPLLLALVLFLWTPPHFWSLAIANEADYRAAGVPMLPAVVGAKRAAHIVFLSTVALVIASLLPGWFGAGPIYLSGAVLGGTYFLIKAWRLACAPSRKTALASFFASLIQLGILLVAVGIEKIFV
jgi:protoheme IX farnesyltransferase